MYSVISNKDYMFVVVPVMVMDRQTCESFLHRPER